LGDRSTADERRAELITKIHQGIHPDKLVKLSVKSVSSRLQDFCDTYNERGKARSAHLALNYLRSFFKRNGFDELDLEDYNWRKNKRVEHVPSKEEVYRIADHCDPRGRAIILCAFQSGLRNATLRSLCYGDLLEQLVNGKLPVVIYVNSALRERVPEACKEDAEYCTFLAKEAVDALREYVVWRCEKYGSIGDDEPLFLPYESFSYKHERNRHLSEDSLQRLIKRAARRARISGWRHVRFHSLRKSFRGVLDSGYTNDGQMAEDDKEYLMGHRLPGAKEPYHNANANVLGERYMKLKWASGESMTESLKLEAIEAFARSLGIKNIEVKIAKIKETESELTEEEAIGRIIRKELGLAKIDLENPQRKTKVSRRVIDEEELEKYLSKGWNLQTTLPSGRIIIQKGS